MNNKPKTLFISIASAFLAYAYAVWSNWGDPEIARIEVYGLNIKPFVFRVLVPWITRLFMTLGFKPEQIIPPLIALFGVGFTLAMWYLLDSFQQQRADLIALGSLAAFVILLSKDAHVYDLPTAFFFALCFAYLARGKFNAYLLTFLISTFNRETTILLTLIFALYFWRRLERKKFFLYLIAQIFGYVVIQFTIRRLYAEAPGDSIWFVLPKTLDYYLLHWGQSILLVVGLSAVVYMVLRQWQEKPAILRLSLGLLGPCMLGLFVLFGGQFEIRTLAEIYPITVLMVMRP